MQPNPRGGFLCEVQVVSFFLKKRGVKKVIEGVGESVGERDKDRTTETSCTLRCPDGCSPGVGQAVRDIAITDTRHKKEINGYSIVSQSRDTRRIDKKNPFLSFIRIHSFIHHASGIGGNSPGHPVPRLRFIKIPSEPFTGNPRSVKLCSCSHTGISAGCRGGGTGAPCGKCSPSSSIVIGGGC
jgi:hypothetical protein